MKTLFYYFLISFIFLTSSLSAKRSSAIYDVTKYGAVNDGVTVNTIAIQKAIDECSSNGGGIVFFPLGKYVSGTILIKDGVTLSLADNTELLGSLDINDYQMVDSFRTGNNALMGYCFIGIVDAKNIGIIGKGIIDGRGKALLDKWGREKRPFLMRVVRCAGIKIKNVRLINSAAWTTHFFASKDLEIEGISIYSRGLSNNDGINIDCTQNVKISNCDIDTGDDALCFKTTWSKMACKDIEVHNLRITSNHGGIKMGTESMAPFENIKISNIYIYDTNNGGIKLFTVDGAHMRNVEISDVVMENVRTPMIFRLGSRLNVFRRDIDSKQVTGKMENVVIKNVKAKSASVTQLKPPSGILITGVPGHYITDLTLENIEMNLPGGGTLENSRHEVPEAIDQYPEVRTFGPTIPAYGIWARHVNGLKLKNITLTLDSVDVRPAIIIQDGKNLEIDSAVVSSSTGTESVIRFENVSGAEVKNIRVSGVAESFVRVEGKESCKINLVENRIPNIKKVFELSEEVKQNVVKIK